MQYKNILELQTKEFNALYKETNKQCPFLSVEDKRKHSYVQMLKNRGLSIKDFENASWNITQDSRKFQYEIEAAAMYNELFCGGLTRYYIKDETLFDFFKETEVRPKEVEAILKSDLFRKEQNYFFIGGVLGKEQAYTLVVQDAEINPVGKVHIVTVLTNEMNYSYCIEMFDRKANGGESWVFNLAMNFLFYITAFPDCVVDGVPNGVKKDAKAKVLSTSTKIVSHTTVEHGFVRPHFRSGYFRHFNSDWYKNCKGQVRFIASTMVKGKAKTVISR